MVRLENISRRTTWHSPDGTTDNQIDNLQSRTAAIQVQYKKSTTLPGADTHSDHDLALATMKLKFDKSIHNDARASREFSQFEPESI